jgi:hypothetical protein
MGGRPLMQIQLQLWNTACGLPSPSHYHICAQSCTSFEQEVLIPAHRDPIISLLYYVELA